LRWSPDTSKIAVWDVTKSGTLKIFSVSGSKVTEVEIFGIHDVIWSPNGQLIAAASAGSKVYLLLIMFAILSKNSEDLPKFFKFSRYTIL